ncbi:MAG: ATP synthase F1 subunit delta [Ignavibacteria bacterium]|nr:ATP synthase F1 subunit delta [Ignavibacteria bacterium]
MSTLKISRRYAKALLSVAVDKNILEAVTRDVETLRSTAEASRDLRSMLRSPVIESRVKKAVLQEALASTVTPEMLEFFNLVIDKGRGDLWREISGQFRSLVDGIEKIERIEVTSAVEIEASQRSALETSIGKKLGKKVVASYRVDPAIMGGAVIRIGDQIQDGSLRHQLHVLKHKLASA